MTLERRKLGTILAALRFYQRALADLNYGGNTIPWSISMIATDDGEFEELTTEEIDALCEELNQ